MFRLVLSVSVLAHAAVLFLLPGLNTPEPQSQPMRITLQTRAPAPIQSIAPAVENATPELKPELKAPAKAVPAKPIIAQKNGSQKHTAKPRFEVSEGVSITDSSKTDSGAIATTAPSQSVVAAPKTVRVNFNTKDLRYSFYLESWQQKVERVGQRMYPGNENGSLRLVVSVNADGSLKNCAVLTSSNSDRLDNQACRIVEAAAPFAPLPPDLKREADVLEIVRAWRFENNNNG